MLVLLLGCMFAFGYCQMPHRQFVLTFNSPIYAYGDKSPEWVDTSQVVVERYNDSVSFMYGDLSFLQKMEGMIIVEINVLKEQSTGYEVYLTHNICDFCKELSDESSYYKNHFQYIELPPRCPIEAGTYKMKEFVFDVEDLELNYSHLGRYELQTSFCFQTGANCYYRDCKFTLKMDISVEEVIS